MKPEEDPLATAALNLPVCDIPPRDHTQMKISWETVTAETEVQRRFYMEHYDSPEKRLGQKNPKPFRL